MQSEESLEAYLDPQVFENEGTRARIRSSLRAGRLITIRDALRREFADAVWAGLDRSDRWKLHEGPDEAQTPFFYRHHNIYDLDDYPPALLAARGLFDSEATRRWAGEISGRDCGGPVLFSASYYMPGDHSTPHSDADRQRQVAFVWHLTRDWEPRWGGSLFWCPAGRYLPPAFNSLSLFNVSPDSCHFVQQVAPRATGKRLAVNGWWTTGQAIQRPVPERSPVEKLADGKVTVYSAYPWVGRERDEEPG